MVKMMEKENIMCLKQKWNSNSSWELFNYHKKNVLDLKIAAWAQKGRQSSRGYFFLFS